MAMIALLLSIGLFGGLLAGWVGLGGGIILAPLLLFAPPAFGLAPLGMKEVARLTILQSLCSTAAAGIAHRRARRVHGPLVLWMGGLIAVASLIGAMASETRFVASDTLLGLFAAMALGAAALMLRPPVAQAADPRDARELPPFSRSRAALIACSVGLLGGMVGQSGAFLTIPLLVQGLGLPVRLAIGSSLGITFCAALAGSAGKLLGGGPILWYHLAPVVAGSLAGSQLGASIHRRLPTASLRYALALLIGASAIRMWYQLLG